MINITKQGKFIIPENECFIGYAGDNLNTTKQIFVEGVMDISLIYRMYLKFDDGTCNYFLLDSDVQECGTLLTWKVTSDQIFKSGIVQVQIKASNDSGEVFHSSVTTMLVQTSVEFSDFFNNKENSEFLRYEKILTTLKTDIEDLSARLNQTLFQAEEVLRQLNFAEVDPKPMKDSERFVQSGGVYSALATKMDYSSSITVSSLNDFNEFFKTNCIYDVTVAAGTLEGIKFPYEGRVFNINSFQFLILNDGRVFSRHIDSGTPFAQICFTKDEIIDFVSEALAS